MRVSCEELLSNFAYNLMLRRYSLAPEDLSRSPTGDVFIKSNKIKGILPEILEELLGARKRAKVGQCWLTVSKP